MNSIDAEFAEDKTYKYIFNLVNKPVFVEKITVKEYEFLLNQCNRGGDRSWFSRTWVEIDVLVSLGLFEILEELTGSWFCCRGRITFKGHWVIWNVKNTILAMKKG